MPPYASFSSEEELQTRNFEPPRSIRLQDEDAYSPSPSSSSNAVIELRPRSPMQSTIQTLSSASSQTSESEILDDDKDSPSAPERERSESVASNKSEEKVEKRKRSRVTPEQLRHLERFFLLDRNPTAIRRREISRLLGMQERQTQIWFQNRAKAKLPDGRHQRHRRATVEIPPLDSPPQLSASIQVDLHNMIHEDETVTIIPCTDLAIGSWRRMATTAAKYDLVAYVSDVKRCLIWYIHSDGFGFKMEIPFNTVVETKLTNIAPGSGLASFLLSEPPLFYLENIEHVSADGNPKRHWKRGPDWTEGQQASRILRHDLIGSAPQLSHLLLNLRSIRNRVPTDICAQQPSFRLDQTNQSMPTMMPLELPPPPLASLQLSGPGIRYPEHDVTETSASHHSSYFEKRSSYVGPGVTPSPDTPFSNEGDRPPPYSAPGTMSFSFAQQQSHQRTRQPTSVSFAEDGGSAYPGFETHGAIHRSHSADNSSELLISHDLAPRPYSAQAIPRSLYNDISYHNTSQPEMQPYHMQGEESLSRVSTPSSATSVYTTHEQLIHLGARHQQHIVARTSPSPPLLTTPYHPPPHLFNQPMHTGHMGSGSSPLNLSYSDADYQASRA